MQSPETKPLRKMTEQELEIEISHTFDAMYQQKQALFQFFYYYNNITGYIPNEEMININEKIQSAFDYSAKTLTVTAVSALILDVLYLRRKTANFSRFWKLGWRIPYYVILPIYGYGYGYEKGFKPVVEEMEKSVERNRLDYDKYRNVYKSLYRQKIGEPLPEFEVDDK